MNFHIFKKNCQMSLEVGKGFSGSFLKGKFAHGHRSKLALAPGH
jgi:hypothetical protein